jgi:hypothetical protein
LFPMYWNEGYKTTTTTTTTTTTKKKNLVQSKGSTCSKLGTILGYKTINDQ